MFKCCLGPLYVGIADTNKHTYRHLGTVNERLFLVFLLTQGFMHIEPAGIIVFFSCPVVWVSVLYVQRGLFSY